jgi:hypothetical protein
MTVAMLMHNTLQAAQGRLEWRRESPPPLQARPQVASG